MKFGQQLASQKIPAWDSKYIRYDQLKVLLKHLKRQTVAEQSLAYPESDLHLQCIHCGVEVPIGEINVHLRTNLQDRSENLKQLITSHSLLFDPDKMEDHPLNVFWRMIVDDLHIVDQWYVHQMEKNEKNIDKAIQKIDRWLLEKRENKSVYNYHLRKAGKLLSNSLIEQYQLLTSLISYSKLNREGFR